MYVTVLRSIEDDVFIHDRSLSLSRLHSDLDSTKIDAFDVSVPTGEFNLTKLSASFAQFKDIPSVVFNAPVLDK
ncbi:hypothetical protein P43SY_011049 [Pythium insidiosum]|uniref:Uncharacterized protein n=1 Tax=Pythium insidiosum TaxID=114742 RepID=A0AAD5Q3S1_PYTIN|nr:hypothetical protein P43SY_011049 [Pythium insidiosum]